MKAFALAFALLALWALQPRVASAEAIESAPATGWSPEGYLLSFGVGAYRPDPGTEEFEVIYPGDNGPLLLVEFDFFLYRIPFVGPIGLGVAGGWAGYKGFACEAEFLPQCVPSTQRAKFSLFPINAMAVVRVDALARYTPVPFVFTGKIGFNSLFFSEDAGAGKQSGRTHGLGWAIQFAIELNFINERRANALDEDWGINSSFFFFELAGSDANSRAPLGDNLYFTGGLGLTF
ncbi:MAG: hypothetical protein WBG86_03785 [Polyangiales bacterium]